MITTSEDVWTWHEGTVVESFLNTYEAYPVVSPDGRTIVTKTAGSSSVTLWCRP
jgi:hypothetical protein